MKRRKVLTLGVVGMLGGASPLAWPSLGRAQQPRAQQPKTPTVGVLMPGSSSATRFWETFVKAMNDVGYVEGKNVRFERRVDEGGSDDLPDLAAELVRLKVDIIVPLFTSATAAAKQATQDIPIVMVGPGDPVASGLVQSLEHPGGNITGTTSMASDLAGRCVELIRQVMPDAAKVGVLLQANSPFSEPFLRKIQEAGQANSTTIEAFTVHGYKEIDALFETLEKNRPDALIVQPSLPSRYIAGLALRNKLPSVSTFRVFAEDGGLMSYWVAEDELFARTARLVVEVLKGKKPADIPVEPATKHELVLNRATATALGLKLSQGFLDHVDDTIE